MRVLIGQINTTPGDFAGNLQKIKDGLDTLTQSKVDIAVFPELSICGYLSRDLMFEKHYIEKNLKALQELVAYSAACAYLKDVAIVVGYIDVNTSGFGKPFRNMLGVIMNGAIIGTYQKHLLPFYDVFDEGRYYEPGKDILVLKIADKRVGFCICEDVWNDKSVDGYSYDDNPIQRYRDLNVGYIVNISSSPFVIGKPRMRSDMLTNVTDDFTLIYVNQVGGQDDLVFDGHSTIIERGAIRYELASDECYKICDTKVSEGWKPRPSDIATLHQMIVTGLRDYITKSGFKQIVLGSSGGIDSAVVAALAAEAIGPQNVHCIMMPSIYSSEGSVKDAQELHKNLECNEYKIPIDHENTLHDLKVGFGIERATSIDMNRLDPKWIYESLIGYNKVADENIQARLRGMYVMYFSNAMGALALTTGNKTELATGYCTLYGDMNGGFAPISDLYKMDVYALAKEINKHPLNGIDYDAIPEDIIDKAPSAELAPGQTDEASLLPYPILDTIVKAYVENYIDTYESFVRHVRDTDHKWKAAVLDWIGLDRKITNEESKKQFNRIIRLININEFKRRQAAPGIKLSKVAFGTGRRLPIVKKF